MTRAEYRRAAKAEKKALKSPMLDLSPRIMSENEPNGGTIATLTGQNGQILNLKWEKNDLISKGVDTEEKYWTTMKDSAGEYEFIMEKAEGDNVYVTVEGTHHRRNLLSKAAAAWEWDMVWNVVGWPVILKGFET